MIDGGLVNLINSNSAVAAVLGTNTGGFPYDELPKNLSLLSLPSWAYEFYGGVAQRGLTTVGGLRWRRFKVHSIGLQDQTAALDAAITTALIGYAGTLSDGTIVDSIWDLAAPAEDHFDSVTRTFRRVSEFQVWFYQ